MSFPAQTTGVGVIAKILVPGNETPSSTVPGKNNVTISLSGSGGFPTSFQLVPQLVDVHGTVVAGTHTIVYNTSGTYSYTGGTSPVSGTRAAVVSVSSAGLITANGVEGGAVVEVAYPTFNNSEGTTGAIAPNPETGFPKDKVYAEVNVTVVK